jgi:membrane protease YdiL (CAAX protease family)
LTQNNLKKDIYQGIILFPPFYLSVILLLHLLTREGFSHMGRIPSPLIPRNALEIVEGLLMVMVVAMTEEIIFRGYLLTRLIEITGNSTAGILISSLLFALGHVYEGTAGVATIFYIGVIFSLLFLKKKNLTVNIVLHFLIDFIPIVLRPILK